MKPARMLTKRKSLKAYLRKRLKEGIGKKIAERTARKGKDEDMMDDRM